MIFVRSKSGTRSSCHVKRKAVTAQVLPNPTDRYRQELMKSIDFVPPTACNIYLDENRIKFDFIIIVHRDEPFEALREEHERTLLRQSPPKSCQRCEVPPTSDTHVFFVAEVLQGL